MDFCLKQDNAYRFRKDSYWALANRAGDLIPLLQFAGQSESNYQLFDKDAMHAIPNAVRVRTTRAGVTACHNAITLNCFPPLIRMIEEDDVLEVQHVEPLLQAMTRRIRADTSGTVRQSDIPWNNIPAIEYLHSFTRSKPGFLALAETINTHGNLYYRRGYNTDLSQLLALFTLKIVHLAAGHDTRLRFEPIELSAECVPGLLDAVLGVVRCLRPLNDSEEKMSQLSEDTLDLLKAAVSENTWEGTVGCRLACVEFWKGLHDLCTSGEKKCGKHVPDHMCDTY
ncbi:hypothetical protein RhiJN_18451 [Ceratobasidium sp. AG-Ba]|nr:hypothetical protein RhiJN_18451 [Ceratobasidium sp. AG-Ba]